MAPLSDAGFQATLAALLAIELSASAAVAEAARVRIGEGEIAFGGSGSGQWSKAGGDGSTSPGLAACARVALFDRPSTRRPQPLHERGCGRRSRSARAGDRRSRSLPDIDSKRAIRRSAVSRDSAPAAVGQAVQAGLHATLVSRRAGIKPAVVSRTNITIVARHDRALRLRRRRSVFRRSVGRPAAVARSAAQGFTATHLHAREAEVRFSHFPASRTGPLAEGRRSEPSALSRFGRRSRREQHGSDKSGEDPF